MEVTNIFTKNLDGTARQITWNELNQLKKDILWMFDENGSQLHHAFVPDGSFNLPYWEYVTLNGDQYFQAEAERFYQRGTLIVVLCMVAEYIDLSGGSQLVFGKHQLGDVLDYVRRFDPADETEVALKQIAMLGLMIAASISAANMDQKEFDHPQLHDYYSSLPWVSKTFVKAYYKAKLDVDYA